MLVAYWRSPGIENLGQRFNKVSKLMDQKMSMHVGIILKKNQADKSVCTAFRMLGWLCKKIFWSRNSRQNSMFLCN